MTLLNERGFVSALKVWFWGALDYRQAISETDFPKIGWNVEELSREKWMLRAVNFFVGQ
jgi:hypothetical protein